MEAIGTLVGGIAHDFNNMLAGITGNIYLAKHALEEGSDMRQNLDDAEHLSFRSADLIRQLLTFARKDMVSMKEIPLIPFIKEVFKFIRTSIPETIDIQLNVNGDDLLVYGDTAQIHQVLLNLINNARDALENTPNPSIECGSE